MISMQLVVCWTQVQEPITNYHSPLTNPRVCVSTPTCVGAATAGPNHHSPLPNPHNQPPFTISQAGDESRRDCPFRKKLALVRDHEAEKATVAGDPPDIRKAWHQAFVFQLHDGHEGHPRHSAPIRELRSRPNDPRLKVSQDA